MREVPGAAIGIGVRVGGVGKGAVDTLALPRRGRPVDRGPGERMAEPHLPTEIDEPGGGRRRPGPGLDAELAGRPPEHYRIPGRLRRGGHHQQPGRPGHALEPLQETFLDPAR